MQELAVRLARQEREKEALQARVAELRQQVAQLQQQAVAEQPKLQTMSRRLAELKIIAELVPLEGPGVIVEISDSTERLLPGQDPNELILHNYQVAMIVNDLWAAGADAVAVNGERIAATTPIRSVATTFMINTRRLTPPLQIVTIGDSARLAAHVSRRDGILDLLRAMRFPVKVRRAGRVTVPTYDGAISFKHTQARPTD